MPVIDYNEYQKLDKNITDAYGQGQPALPNGGYQQDPYLSNEYVVDDWEMPVKEIEEGGLPGLVTLDIEDYFNE